MALAFKSDLLRSEGPSYLIGPAYFGSALDQTGQIVLYNSSSVKETIIQAGNATASVTYTWPTSGPASNGYLMASTTAGVLSWFNATGTYGPLGSSYVTISSDATLTAERVLTGTSNQIVITDNGANSTVVLSTPQNIHTGASPTFNALTLSGGLIIGGNTTGDSNYGTIGSVTNTAYYEGTFSIPFTGAFTSTVTAVYRRIGKIVFLRIPSSTGTATSGAIQSSVNAVPSNLRPSHAQYFLCGVNDNGAAETSPGLLQISTVGTVTYGKTINGSAFTNGASCGLNTDLTLVYDL